MATFTSNGTPITGPSPEYDLPIVCNNGALKYGVISKNLLNTNAVTENKYITATGTEQSDNSYVISDYIYVSGKSYITLSTTDTSTYPFGGTACKAFYDVNKNYISGTATVNSAISSTNPVSVAVPSNAVYFRTSVRKGVKNYAQVEYGNTATTFVPYQEGIYVDGTVETVTDSLSNTATAQMLLKVGTYKDTQELISGAVTRNVGIKVLDGTENWQTTSNVNVSSLTLTDLQSNVNVLCNSYNSVMASSYSVLDMPNYSIKTHPNSDNLLYIRNNNYSTSEGFKAYLADQYAQGTPVILVYPLATATAESVTAQTLNVQKGTNTLTATGSISTLGLSATYTKFTLLKPNYVIRNDKLVWAKPNMYLTGPVNYTLVGNGPTIVDDVASNFADTGFLRFTGTQFWSYDNISSWEFGTKIKTGTVGDSRVGIMTGGSYCEFTITQTGELFFTSRKYNTETQTYSWYDFASGYIVSSNTEYIIKLSCINSVTTMLVYDTDMTLLGSHTENIYMTIGSEGQKYIEIGRSSTSYSTVRYFNGSVDLKETYINVNGSLLFYGKNYASQNIAPVPSGYTYGTTTTTGIGWVDMRTQVFTAAPSGATLEKES